MVAEASAEICHMIQALNMYEEAEDLCLYMPIRNEVDLEILRKAAWEDGKRVWLPKVDGKQMEFHFFGPESRLEEGAYGISGTGSRPGLSAGRSHTGGDAGSCFF